MFLTPDRLLVLAIAVTVLVADGIRRMIRQRRDGQLDVRPYRILLAVMVAGALLTWSGVIIVWLRS